MAKVRADAKSIRTLTVKVRYNDMDEEQASESLAEPTDLETEIYAAHPGSCAKPGNGGSACGWFRSSSRMSMTAAFAASWPSMPPPASTRPSSAWPRSWMRCARKFGRSVLLRGHDFILRAKHSRGEEPVTAPVRSASLRLASMLRAFRVDGSGARNQFRAGRRPAPAPGKLHRPPAARGKSAPHHPGLSRPGIALSRFKVHGSKFKIQGSSHSPSTIPLPLNVHSYYSFLDSTLSIRAIIELAQRHELPAIALTDKNNLHGAVEFAQAAAAARHQAHHRRRDSTGAAIASASTSRTRPAITISAASSARGKMPKIRRPEVRSRRQKAEGRRSEASGQFCNFGNLQLPNLQFGLRSQTDGLLAVSPAPDLAPFFPDRFYLEVSSLEALEKLAPSSLIHQSINPSIHSPCCLRSPRSPSTTRCPPTAGNTTSSKASAP